MKKIFISLFISLLLCVAMVSALEIDNVKSYNENTRTATIKNSFLGIPTTQIATVQLITPLNVKVHRGYNKVAEFKITGFKDYKNFISELEFYDLKNSKNKINRDYDLKVKGYEEVLIDDYDNVLTGYSENDTAIYESQKVGSHYETRETWTKLTPADIKKNDILVIGIFTDVQEGDVVDWVSTVAGVKIPEWAVWTEGLNSGLVSFWDFDEASNTIIDKVGSNNFTTLSGAITYGRTGKIDDAIYFDSSDYASTGNVIGLDNLSANHPTGTFNIWYKSGATYGAGYKNIFQLYDGDKAIALLERDDADNPYALLYVTDTPVYTSPFTYYSQTQSWKMITLTLDVGDAELFVDGVSQGTSTLSTFILASNTKLHIGNFGIYAGTGADADYDLFGIWDRVLTQSEITQLYNTGDGMSYDGLVNDGPTVTQISPDNNTIYTTALQEINFICYAEDSINLTSVDFYLNGSLTQTNTTGINGTNYTFTETLDDGYYNWSCLAYDNTSTSTSTGERFLRIHSTAPQFNLHGPTENATTFNLPHNVTLNVTTIDELLSECWYYTDDNITNITYTCNSTTEVTLLTEGYKKIYIFANNTAGTENSTSTSFYLNYIQESADYDNSTIEAETHEIILNIIATEITSFNGTLNYYNGTTFNTTAVYNGTHASLTTTLTAPPIEQNENITFNWTYNLNGEDYNTSDYYQQLLYLTPIEVATSCVDKALKFEFKNEENGSSLIASINYNFEYGLSNNSLKKLHGTLTGVSTFYVCINSSLSNAYKLGYGEIQYTNPGYTDRRYYTYVNRTLTNQTTNETLFLLEDADATSFLYNIESSLLAPYVGAYISLIRWYPELDTYDTVEMAKTDEKGQTIMRVKTEDVDYRVGVNLANGTLISLREAVRFACLSSPCSYTVKVSDGEADYTSYYGVESSLTYDEDTFLWSYVWNDPTQSTESMRFLVRRKSAGGYATICEETGTGYIGSMSCNSSGYTGLIEGVAFRTASPEIPIASLLFDTRSSGLTNGFGLFISVFITLALMLIGIFSPVAVIILGVVGLFFAYTMGIVPLIFVIAIGVVGGLIIHFLKKA